MASNEHPTPQLLRQLLRYVPETGKLYWRERSPSLFEEGYRTAEGCAANWNARWAGREAFTAKMAAGHLHGRINYKPLLAHRVIWAMYYGEWPTREIDHINHDGADNRIANLREVNHATNQQNQSMRVNNTSGVTGVGRYKPLNQWYARIKSGGKLIHLGYYDRIEDAIEARRSAEIRFGFHPNHGI